MSNVLIGLGLLAALFSNLETSGWVSFVDSRGVQRYPATFSASWTDNVAGLTPPERLVSYPPAFWAAPSKSLSKPATILQLT